MTELVVRGLGGLAQEITARMHRILSDEPIEGGGTDAGPTPSELMLAALGSCTAITVRLYAQRKGWPLEQVERLRHEKVHVRTPKGARTVMTA